MRIQKLKYGIVGAGSIAQAYAQAFEKSGTAGVAAIVDVRFAAAQALADRFTNCRAFVSYEKMADETSLDAVIVCTPPATHEKVCLHFLKRKIHVLCEKPLSVSVSSARRMLETAEAEGVMLTMASKFRYVEDVVRARSIVESGILGEIVLFENAFTSRVDMTSRWNSDPLISGGGVLIDNGTHSVDLTRYFLGPLADVQVVEGKRSQGLTVEETIRVSVKSVSGVMGSIDLSWSIDKELDSYINIYGSLGTIRVGWCESKYRLSPNREWTVFGQGYDKVQAFGSQLDNFSRAIKGLEPLRITATDALASVEAVEAAYAALHHSQWTAISGEMSGADHQSSSVNLNNGAHAIG